MNAAAERLLRESICAGDADLWGNTIRHSTVRAALALIDDTRQRARTSPGAPGRWLLCRRVASGRARSLIGIVARR